MAMKPLDERIDELSAVEQDVADIAVSQPAEPLPEPIEYTTEPTEFEPTEVAGIGSIIRKAIKSAPKKTERPIISPEKEIDKVGPYQVVPEATAEKAEEVLVRAAETPPTGAPPETVFNLNRINGDEGFKQFIEATAKTYGADKLVKVSYKDVAAKAADEGYDEAFIARMMNSGFATQADPREAYKMLLALTDADKRAYDLGQQVVQARDAGTLSSDLATEFQQAVALAGNLSKAVKGRQADIARTLGIFSQAREATVTRGAQLDAIMAEAGGLSNVYDLAKKFTALDARGARVNMAEKSIGGTLKDIWFSTWINGLLSAPTTHAKNIAGNMFFGSMQIPERAIAAAIGKTRNAIFGGEDAIQFTEVYSQAYGMLQGLREGLIIGPKAFVKNEPTDPFTKIEDLRKGKNPFDIDFGPSETGQALSKMLDYWGTFVTLPGRALMAEDEFFKAIGYRMELNALASRAADVEYKRLIANGMPDDDAARAAAAHQTRILTDTPADIDEAAKAMSRTVTFTRELEPGLAQMQKFLQNPLMKMFVPFVRTPTNITLETMSRTPGINFASPRFWADWNAGGVKRDMAMARVTLGSGIIFATGTYALEGKITGYGPMRRGDREAMKGTGWQEFSLVFNRSDVSDDLLDKYKGMTSVTEGDGKVYVSYMGLEPLGTLLGIASTAGEYSMMNAGEADMEQLMLGGSLGIYQYLSEMPMLQGIGDLTKVFTSGAQDSATMFYNILSQATKQVTDVAIGGSPLGAHNAMVAAIERLVDPTQSNILEARADVEFDIASGAAKGFWESVNRAKSRNPLTSDSLPPMLDPLTGDVKRVGKGNLYEMFNPFRLSDGKVAPAHATLVEYGVPMYFPPKKIDGVELTADQYNNWIQAATEDGKLAERVTQLGQSPELIRLAGQDLSVAQTLLSQEISKAYSLAKQRMLSPGDAFYDPDLAEKLEEIKMLEAESGKYRR